MDATSWMLPRSWVVFWNVACPAHPGPRSIEQTPSKQWRWRNGSNTSRVHTPPRVQGKSSTHSCQNWWDWICHRSQGLKISSLSCGSSYFICLLFKQTSHDLMISPLQQWLNHSAPKKKTTPNLQPAIWNNVWDCLFLRKLPTNHLHLPEISSLQRIWRSFHPTTPQNPVVPFDYKGLPGRIWTGEFPQKVTWLAKVLFWRPGFCFWFAKLQYFTHLDFPEIRKFPLLNHHLGQKLVWGRYNLTRWHQIWMY